MNTIRGGTVARQSSFESLVEAHAGIVFRVARTYCRDHDDQLDLVQEIKVQLWRSFARFDERQVFSTWMYRIALNVAISWTRKSAGRIERSTDLDSIAEPSAPPSVNDELTILYAMIDGLDPLNRALLLLYLEDLSHAEIEEVLGISAGNVATKISRLKQQLRQEANLLPSN